MNFNYQTSPLLIETFIVPQSVTDSIIEDAVEKFRNRFCPLWVNMHFNIVIKLNNEINRK